MSTTITRRGLVALTLVAATALAACGSDEKSSSRLTRAPSIVIVPRS